MATPMPAAGKLLGRYQILKPLAKGGMAEVFLARTIGIKGFERHVVLKFIRVEHGANPQTVEMLLDEARLVAALHHRNIVQVHDVGEDAGQYFFAMEYVHGEDGRALLRKVKEKKQQIPFQHVLTVITAAAAGLHYAHEMRGPDRKPLGIVHRDISPGNILLGFDGGVKVVDFGIAKTDRQEENTKAGELKGKVGYMSPEQCKALPLDRRTDIYMLGIVLYELCTVRRLFKGDNRFETMQHIVEGNIHPPSRYRKDLPDELERIIMKALATDQNDRYQTADDLRLVLEAFATRTNFQISPSKLSDYLKDIFGERPEPWLVDAAPPEVTKEQLDAAVILSPELLAEMDKPRQSEPVLEPVAAKPVSAEKPAPAIEPTDDTPMAWPVDQGAGRRKRNVLLGIGALAIAGGIAAFVMTRGGSDTENTASASANNPATTGATTGSDTPTTPAVVPADASAAAVAETPADAAATATAQNGSDAVDENDIQMTNNGSAAATTTPDAGVQVGIRPNGGRGPKGGGPRGGGPKAGGEKAGGEKAGGEKAGAGEGSGKIKIDRPTGPDLDSPMPD